MKRIISILAVCLCLLSLGACAKQQKDAPQQLKEKIPNAYVGDVDVQQTIQIADLKIVIKKTVFYINDIEFSFRDFEQTEKISTNMGKDMLDVYVKDGALQKCVVTSADNTTVTQYNVEGKGSSVEKVNFDEYGNKTYVAYYDGAGKLQNFYTATYDKDLKITEKREYNATLDLTAVIEYEYDNSGKPTRELVYDASLQLKEVKDVGEEK